MHISFGSRNYHGASGKAPLVTRMDRRPVERIIALNKHLKRKLQRHRKTAEALKRSERLFHAAIDALSANIAILNRDGVIMAVNRAWRQFADENGFSGRDYGIGTSYLELCDRVTGNDSEIAGRVATGIRDLLAGRKPEFSLEYTCQAPQQKRWFQLNATTSGEADDPCIVVAHHDITDVKLANERILEFTRQLEDRVRQRTIQLELKNHELEGFCYSVSHDLRGRLARLEGYGRGLLEDYGPSLDNQARHYVERICLISIELRKVIDALLDLSMVTRCDFSVREINLSLVAEAAIEELRRRQPRRHVSITIAPNLMVKGDPSLITLVMEHLLENAWKFTGKRDNAVIEVGMKLLHGMKVFYVRDNGAGFDMRYAGRLFQPFQRLHSPAEFEGTGIGLATVQRIIQRHGGRIWAEGEVDRGATFYFVLPPDCLETYRVMMGR